MKSVGVMIVLFVLGAALGSFACCQVWRMRKKDKTKWSHCMNCKYRLRWYDNIPIISWLLLGGKCRKCRKPIGWMEFLAEVGLGGAFVLSFACWPWRNELMNLEFAACLKYGLFLVNLVIWSVLLMYDVRWRELPVVLMVVVAVISLMYLGVDVFMIYGLGGEVDWLSIAGALMILPGFYYLMYRISKEKWVGGGDWILCLSLAIMLGNFWLAMFALFAANIIGSVFSLPLLMKKKGIKKAVPFGPFLILGFLVVFFLQAQILSLVAI